MKKLEDGFRYCSPGWESKFNRIMILVLYPLEAIVFLGCALIYVMLWSYDVYLAFRGDGIGSLFLASLIMIPMVAFLVHRIRYLWWEYVNATRTYRLCPEGMEIITRKKYDMIPWDWFYRIQVVPCGGGQIGVIRKYCICCMRCPQKDVFLEMVELRGPHAYYNFHDVIFIDFDENVFQEISELYPKRILDLRRANH